MNKLKYIYLLLLLPFIFIGCSRDKFADMNTNPDDLLTVAPELEFTSALVAMHSYDNEYYYDHNRAMYYWTQTFVFVNGAPEKVFTGTGNLNQRYKNFYTKVGNQLVDVQKLIEKMTGDQREKYTHLHALTYIPLAYYAFYVSDVQGSIAYTEAFQSRYTGVLTPKYDVQEVLFDTLQAQLKRSIAILKTNPAVSQVNLGKQDVYYGGKLESWIKAANSLRLRMAMRLMNKDPEKMKTLIGEIMADDGGLISSNDENWQLAGAPATFANSGNYNPNSNDKASGSYNNVNFMWQHGDPRVRVFFQEAFTKDEFDSAKAQGKLPTTLVWDGQKYRGQYASPDKSTDPTVNYDYSDIVFSYKGASTTKRWPSRVQDTLFYNPKLTTSITFPMITYAEVCFMRAELAVRGITGDDAQALYYEGIEASINAYFDMGSEAGVYNAKGLTNTEIAAYESAEGVAYDPANALEQICIQAYLNEFRNQNEAWALIKRTGYPSLTSSILKRDVLTVSGAPLVMPRRFLVDLPSIADLNFTNRTAAIREMEKDPLFKTADDITGRVWWDTAN